MRLFASSHRRFPRHSLRRFPRHSLPKGALSPISSTDWHVVNRRRTTSSPTIAETNALFARLKLGCEPNRKTSWPSVRRYEPFHVAALLAGRMCHEPNWLRQSIDRTRIHLEKSRPTASFRKWGKLIVRQSIDRHLQLARQTRRIRRR